MADIRKYIEENLLSPLKYYPTAIQDTIVELIIEKLETLYNYAVAFPEIVSPSSTRLDILRNIANQFLFTIRDEADIEEQIAILDNILYVYSKRGSIDTIENMWKYYGGDLPKDVQVIIPSYNLFRYNISEFSGYHVFPDDSTNHTGIYEIRLTNSTYSIPKLKEFLLKELVAAGNYIYFTNEVSTQLTESAYSDHYIYDIISEHEIDLQLMVPNVLHGLYFSGDSSSTLGGTGYYRDILLDYYSLSEVDKQSGQYDDLINRYNLIVSKGLDSIWSGKENIFVELKHIYDRAIITYPYSIFDGKGNYNINLTHKVVIPYNVGESLSLHIFTDLYDTDSYSTIYTQRDLYNAQEEHVREKIFTLSDSLLGESLGYEPA